MSTMEVNAHIKQHVEQIPQDSLEAAGKLHKDIESKFIEMGQVFSHIKATKIFRMKGYESFKDWVEHEHNMSAKMANKLIRLQRLFVEEMDMDEETLKEIGFDRLMMIAPMVEKADWEKRDELVEQAGELPIPQLAGELKKAKLESQKDAPQDLKKVLVEQWKERFLAVFNCSWTELQFKLALLFSGTTDEALLTIKAQINDAQRQFETPEVTNADR
ncbi:MAG TPA: hypothetical protein P5533_06040 [Candidatus Cloacimonadota bacterium]|nr:hypothetical protein [Candidatus Cloacimonadota bacterium]